MPAVVDISGVRFGMLVAIRRSGARVHPSGQKRSVWLFRCDCGREVEKALRDVKGLDTKSCGCGRSGKPSPNRMADGEASFNGLFCRYKRSAAYRNLEWSIDRDYFRRLTGSNCHYCGIEPSGRHLTHASAFGAYIYNGLDRVENMRGYSPDNVVPCCATCNQAKHVMTESDFLRWISRVYEFSRRSERNV